MRAQAGTAPDSSPPLSSPATTSQAEPALANESGSGTMPPKILIYEGLLLFLKDACTVWTLGRSLGYVARLQTVIDGYLLSMASDSVVSGIVASVENRKILLELCSKLGLDDDPRLRAALRADEEQIAAFIASILESKSTQEFVLNLEGNSAQCLLDVIQDALNRGFLMAPEHSRQARRIIRKLSESCDGLPSSLFITGVTGREEHPTFAGGFGDIYRATYGNKTVAVKHMRHFIQSSEIRDIRLKLCREALVWKDLRHPHILTFIGIDRESFPSSLCMISPWMEHGTVLNYLKDHGRANVDKLLYEIAQGLQYLHSHNIVHGDLRGANILINEDWSACLADFGLSVFANATTTMHTSTRAGSIHWMAPELIDPERFGCKFARTPASDVYAFGCVCFELYTGRPPFSELSQPAALLRVVNGERPRRPPCSPPMSDALWHHVKGYWAEDPATRPLTDVVVKQMVWPSLHPKPKALRPLPLIPVPRPAPPPVSPSEPSSSPPLYVSPQGSPPGYDHADYQRVELTPFKLAQMEKARKQGPSRELDLGHIMKLIGKASDRTLRDQTVILPDGIKTMLEMARRRDFAKRDAFVEQLAEYSDARRFHAQDAVLSPLRKNPEALDPDEIITLPEFVKETPPPQVPDDPPQLSQSLPNKITLRPRRPSLPWLRISPSLTTLRYQLMSSKTSVPESATSVGDIDRFAVSAGPKTSSPLHRRLRSNSETSKKYVRGQSGLGIEMKTPVRERVKDVLAAAASASGSKTDAALRALWRHVMPPVIDTEDARSNSSFSIGRPSEYGRAEDDDEIPTGPIDECDPADECDLADDCDPADKCDPDDECDPADEGDPALDEPEKPPDNGPQLPDNNQKPSSQGHVPQMRTCGFYLNVGLAPGMLRFSARALR
ncbi:kinase-like domain-containing protein [Mycena capillaripes]|nr:kinase-like domain-containing protein [Mycena capillaripes]